MAAPAKPVAVATYPMAAVIMGARTKGMASSGFSTMGIPKIMGSLMPKMAGTADSLAMALLSSLLEKRKMATIRPMVLPQPPMVTYVFQKV